jgi:hypothetical protein
MVPAPAAAQAWGEVVGRVTQAGDPGAGEPIPGATVLVLRQGQPTNYGTAAGSDGRYDLRVPEGSYVLRFSSIGYVAQTRSVTVRRGQAAALDVALEVSTEEIDEVTAQADRAAVGEAGVFTLEPQVVRAIPDPIGNDAIRSVKVLPGVTSSNELSSAYSVRGGGYSENQFFLDGFEVYRPFRTRQGEQEGLGLINADLAAGLTLYAGGFPARYGGKLASVLDVTYARPTGAPSGGVYASGLDAGGVVRGGFLDDRLGVAVAVRRATAGRLFASQELEGVYEPEFRDVQGLVDWELAPGHSLRIVGLVARHRFDFQPQQRRTTFGIFPDQIRTVAFQFVGEERDGYDVRFVGSRLSNRIGAVLAEHEASYFDTEEIEQYDVAGGITLYRVRDPNQSPDDPLNLIRQGAARQRDVADNDIGVLTFTGGGRYRLLAGPHALEAGWQARLLQFSDRLSEYTEIAGSDDFGRPIVVRTGELDDSEEITTGQQALWMEDAFEILRPALLVLTAGVRADHFDLTDEWTISPRASVRWQMNEWTTLSAATGIYYQAPTYRELRGEPGFDTTAALPELNRDLQSQRATIGVMGVDHLFRGTRFALRGELWFKQLANLISYEVEGTRVLYSGENDSEGYAYGADFQFRGEFVPGLESWLNYGFLLTRERFFAPENPTPAEQLAFERRGGGSYIPRPTDRRHNFALFVQDHIPGDDTWTLHLRALFGTGTPFTPPSPDNILDGATVFTPGPRNALRYPEYFRFDMGATKSASLGTVGGRAVRLGLTAEVLNVFDQSNTIAYTFIDSGQGFYEGVPTRLTPRTVNVRLRLDF